MYDRLSVISESGSRISDRLYDDSSVILEEKSSSCSSCSLNRQSRAAMMTKCSFQMNTLSLDRMRPSLDGGAAAEQRRSKPSEATINKVIKNVDNNRRQKISDNSFKQSLLRLCTKTRSILTSKL